MDGAGAERRRFYGRRKGRKLTARQAGLLEQLLPALTIDLAQPLPSAEALLALFRIPPHPNPLPEGRGSNNVPSPPGGKVRMRGDNVPPVSEIWLEIGFGAGEHLVRQAESHPRVGFVGAEPFVNGVAALLAAIEERGLASRVRIHPGDATPLLDWLPPASIGRAFMLFPDPWPKKRHRERRLLQPALLDKLARVLKPGGEFRFASDIADYAEAALAAIEAHPQFSVETLAETARDETEWPVTRYESKARKAGRASTFLIAKRAV